MKAAGDRHLYLRRSLPLRGCLAEGTTPLRQYAQGAAVLGRCSFHARKLLHSTQVRVMTGRFWCCPSSTREAHVSQAGSSFFSVKHTCEQPSCTSIYTGLLYNTQCCYNCGAVEHVEHVPTVLPSHQFFLQTRRRTPHARAAKLQHF